MASGKWREFRRVVQRRRVFQQDQLETSDLKRCLTGWDLTALGLGSTLGVGVYVLVGLVALQYAGPSIILSFLIAAIASMFAGLCYAEFGARVPRAGSAYIYTYVTVGELLAFLVGWNNILESAFGTASVARGLSIYVDTMTNNSMSGWFASALPVGTSQLSPHFDLFAFLVVLLLGVLLASGVRESSMVNNGLAIINTVVIMFIVTAGAFKANSDNWRIPAEQVPAGRGAGGFFPYGALGMLRGAAVCFYGFVGFDSISASGEEVKEPRRTIPLAILTVLTIVFIAYSSVAIVVTMMVPYYEQDERAAVAVAFSSVGWEWARWVVTVGAVFGISASLFGAMFPLPRLLYAMSSDGLLFHCLSRVSASRQTPVIATLLPAAIIALLAGFLELQQLVMMMCIGTLFSYTIVAVCVIVLRYRSNAVSQSTSSTFRQIVSCGQKMPTRTTYNSVIVILILYMCTCAAMALAWRVRARAGWLAALHALAALLVALIALQPTQQPQIPFKTPFVPIIPCLSIYFNIHLMILINIQTWIRVLIWILIGIPIYIICVCCYKRNKNNNLEENIKAFSNVTKNGNTPIQIVVESPTPPETLNRSSNTETGNPDSGTEEQRRVNIEMKEKTIYNDILPYETEEIVVQHAAVVENNEEKEAKIIYLLDKVLQDEEDSYGEIISWKEPKDDDNISTKQDVAIHRKSLSELSDAGSDASLGNNVLSKYDVVAQVHREDLPKVTEEAVEPGEAEELNNSNEIEEQELVTAFNDSESNSGTGESGYSDTIDKTALNDSTEDVPYIPPPPPLDENYFASPYFRKSYTVPKRPSKSKLVETQNEENKPRESINSNSSMGDDNLVFGSDRQITFLSKLNDIFQSKMSSDDVDEQKRRSHSAGNLTENTSFSPHARPTMFLDLKKEITSKEVAQNLRPVNKAENPNPEDEVEDDEDEDISMGKEALKSKLENIFAAGGPQLLKPRLMKSNPPTPEESYQTDNSSTESIPKLPKMDKNDTLKRQKDKFSEVLNSFRLSLNKEDNV